ncbi:MAG: cupin domain-containing protein [Caldilineaceae bacterium]|nr:cupin domain-containing protein [Caldilineaceae bacterium]
MKTEQRSCHPTVTVIHPQSAPPMRHGLPYFFGISEHTAGARGIAMHLVEIPPGGKAAPHYHRNFETAIYVLAGRVETRYGAELCESVINEPGSFLYIPPNVPHQPINLSATQPALAIVARNDAREAEDVVVWAPIGSGQ